MPSKYSQPPPEVIRLTPDDIAALQKLAEETASLVERGPTAGQPSWRSLVKRIARGELRIVAAEGVARQVPLKL